MKRCSLFCLVGFLLFLGARCLIPLARAAVAPQGGGIDPGAAQRLGAPTLATLRGATHVETFRVGVTPGFGQPAPTKTIDDRPVSAPGLSKDRAFAARMTAVLLDPRLYDVSHDRCLFRPGIVFRLWKGRACVDCVMCFHCNDIQILTRDAAGRVIHSEFTNFTPLRPTLLALVKQTFPADQEIQGLPAK